MSDDAITPEDAFRLLVCGGLQAKRYGALMVAAGMTTLSLPTSDPTLARENLRMVRDFCGNLKLIKAAINRDFRVVRKDCSFSPELPAYRALVEEIDRVDATLKAAKAPLQAMIRAHKKEQRESGRPPVVSLLGDAFAQTVLDGITVSGPTVVYHDDDKPTT